MKKATLKNTMVVFAVVIMTAALMRPAQAELLEFDYVPGELIVSFWDEESEIIFPDSQVVSAFLELNSLLSINELESIEPLFNSNSVLKNIFVFRFPETANLEMIATDLEGFEFVKHAGKNWIGEVQGIIPNDYAYNNDWNNDSRLDQWHLNIIQADRAWEITTGSGDIVVMVMDTGMDYGHHDLHNLIWQNVGDGGVTSWGEDADNDGHTLEWDGWKWALDPGDLNGNDSDGNGLVDDLVGYDFVYNQPDVIHDLGGTHGSHGTVMGSMISAMTNNGIGVAGISWNTRLMAAKVSYLNMPWASHVIKALNYAVAMDVDIINMSISIGNDPGLEEAVERAYAAGIILVASAGNYGSDIIHYPAKFPEVICVGALDSDGYWTTGSNFGTEIDICAPSAKSNQALTGPITCMYSTDATPQTYPGSAVPHQFWHSGVYTSGAAAQVSGALALLKSFYPNESSGVNPILS